MILVDTFDSDEEIIFLTEKLKKNEIKYTEKPSSVGMQIFINEDDITRLNELISSLD